MINFNCLGVCGTDMETIAAALLLKHYFIFFVHHLKPGNFLTNIWT